jgi:hypothetical protein
MSTEGPLIRVVQFNSGVHVTTHDDGSYLLPRGEGTDR